MLLPDRCTASNGTTRCTQPPAFAVSILAESGQFLVGVVCGDHKEAISTKLLESQKAGLIPSGNLQFEPIRMVSTDCVTGNEEDQIDVELKRGIDSDRKAA